MYTAEEQVEDWNYSLINVIEHTLYHELGHALLDVYDITFSGKEENVADQFASYYFSFTYEDDPENIIGQDVMLDTAWNYWKISEQYPDLLPTDFADTHGLNKQRSYDALCYAYGAYPNDTEFLFNEGYLPENRAIWCEEEFNQIVDCNEKLENNFQDVTTPCYRPPVTRLQHLLLQHLLLQHLLLTTSPVITPQQQTQGPVVKEVIVNQFCRIMAGSWM